MSSFIGFRKTSVLRKACKEMCTVCLYFIISRNIAGTKLKFWVSNEGKIESKMYGKQGQVTRRKFSLPWPLDRTFVSDLAVYQSIIVCKFLIGLNVLSLIHEIAPKALTEIGPSMVIFTSWRGSNYQSDQWDKAFWMLLCLLEIC